MFHVEQFAPAPYFLVNMAKNNAAKILKLDALEVAAFVIALTGLMLFIAGFIVPPLGEVHPSVLKGIGELLGFVAVFFAWYAVKKGRSAVFTHGNTSATIKPAKSDE